LRCTAKAWVSNKESAVLETGVKDVDQHKTFSETICVVLKHLGAQRGNKEGNNSSVNLYFKN
jgi:hypothetical protein